MRCDRRGPGVNLVVQTEYPGNGDGEVTADADLTQAELIVSPLGWQQGGPGARGEGITGACDAVEGQIDQASTG